MIHKAILGAALGGALSAWESAPARSSGFNNRAGSPGVKQRRKARKTQRKARRNNR